jgi:predicted small metal-binding protein
VASQDQNRFGSDKGDEMSKHIACGDVVSGCKFTATALTEEELLKKVVAHASSEHGVTEVSPELAAKVKAAIKDGTANS